MEKVFIAMIVIGLSITGYFGYQWFDARAGVDKISTNEEDVISDSANESAEAPDDNNSEEQGDSSSVEASGEPEAYTLPEGNDTDKGSSEASSSDSSKDSAVMSDEIDQWEKGENVAKLKIPELGNSYSVYWGTDDESLDQGVGMYVSEWTTTPDESRHTVLSGHRDTVFTGLDELEDGDSLIVEYENTQYVYRLQKTWVTDAEDRSVIVDKDEPTLTLTTCYPFDYIGSAPDRYIVEAELEQTNSL
ncbi:class D sortase [Marinococcus sp. PL1-022]|uniref:class D sortase n=1 Tax=Marinococcus sp. PL1-022 TaxID=3095363 RepID=UPI0029C4E84C|nr:class D sortase [Marinococcus sp. PL1-022]MDX6154284.1 class D sortase [Marinococcus sp. PL1-022]